MLGFPAGAPYAAIIAAAGGEAIPQTWIDQLAIGGRLIAPVVGKTGPANLKTGTTKGQSLVVLDKTAQGVRQTVLEAVHFVPLKSGVA
jgi:protein-L-isoaspartate(D-aspartate) O-methyltransferase